MAGVEYKIKKDKSWSRNSPVQKPNGHKEAPGNYISVDFSCINCMLFCVH